MMERLGLKPGGRGELGPFLSDPVSASLERVVDLPYLLDVRQLRHGRQVWSRRYRGRLIGQARLPNRRHQRRPRAEELGGLADSVTRPVGAVVAD